MICYFVDSVLLLGLCLWCMPGNAGLAGTSVQHVAASLQHVFIHRPSHGRLAMASYVAMSCGFSLCNYFLELHDASALLLTPMVFLQLWQFKSKV